MGHILNGIALVAYIKHDSSRLRLSITSRGAALILRPYSASMLPWKTPFKPIVVFSNGYSL